MRSSLFKLVKKGSISHPSQSDNLDVVLAQARTNAEEKQPSKEQ